MGVGAAFFRTLLCSGRREPPGATSEIGPDGHRSRRFEAAARFVQPVGKRCLARSVVISPSVLDRHPPHFQRDLLDKLRFRSALARMGLAWTNGPSGPVDTIFGGELPL